MNDSPLGVKPSHPKAVKFAKCPACHIYGVYYDPLLKKWVCTGCAWRDR